MRSALFAGGVVLLGAGSLSAAKIPEDFRAAFEGTYRKQQAFAVLVQAGLPTMSVHGPRSTYKTGHYEIDVVDGRWKTSESPDDQGQLEMDRLRKGEVLSVAGIGYKDNRIDLRMVALEPRKISRKGLLDFVDKSEAVATKFRFFLPFEKSRVLTPADLPAVQKYVEAYLKVFPDEASARSYAARVAPKGTASAAQAARPEVRRGMTADEVREVLGKPLKEVNFGASAQWKYADLTVVFENGRVRDLK